MKMGRAELCPSGTEITTEGECDSALKHAGELGIALKRRKTLQVESWSHIPHQCSYQYDGDKAFYFNSRQTNNVPQFLSGQYRMICKKGKCILVLIYIIVNIVLLLLLHLISTLI